MNKVDIWKVIQEIKNGERKLEELKEMASPSIYQKLTLATSGAVNISVEPLRDGDWLA